MADEESTQDVVLDYTSRDFDAIRSMLVGIARGKFPDWVTVGEAGDFGTLLLELYAYMGDVMNYYIDRVGSEAFLGTAQRRQSILYIADMLGYRPVGQQAANVVLRASLPSDATGPYRIYRGTELKTADDVSPETFFELDYDITLNPGDTDVLGSATEGRTVTEIIGTSKGVPNAEFVLSKKGVVFSTIVLTTDEGGQTVEWAELDRVVNARATQSAYSTYVDDEGFTHVVFGDNSAGRVPPNGVVVTARYRYGVGAAANEIPAGKVNQFTTVTPPTGFTISNFDTPLGGSDIETTESMRFSIPRSIGASDRAVTLQDYVSLTTQVPGVGKAYASGEIYSAVTVRIAPTGGAAGTEQSQMDALRDSVHDWLSDRVMIGSHVYVEDVYGWDTDAGAGRSNADQGWEEVEIDMDLYVQSGYNRTAVETNVQTAVEDALSFDTMDFGAKVSVGYIYRTIMSVPGVDYVDLSKMTSPSSTNDEAVHNILPPVDRIPRLRPEVITDISGSDFITQEYGLTITTFGGLVNT